MSCFVAPSTALLEMYGVERTKNIGSLQSKQCDAKKS